jgi:hypothetical protein
MESPSFDNRVELGLESSENFSSKIEIHFFRHDEKGSSEGKTDQEVTLTEKGRINAAANSDEENIDQSVSFGSPRLRSRETALLHMAGHMFTEDELREGEYTLDKLIDKIGTGKIAKDERLDFSMGENKVYLEHASQAFKTGTFLKFLVERSDELVEEVGDKTAGSYSKVAAGIAQIVKKYLTIAPRFDELLKEKPEQYKNVMKRFMGSHQTTTECFLAKVIEKTEGTEARDRFVAVLNNQGFDFSEGYE